MKSLEELRKKAENDLDKVVSKGELTASDWDAAKKGLEILEKIAKICAYEGYDDGSYEYDGSGRRGHVSYSYGPRYNMPQPWDNSMNNGYYGNGGAYGNGSYRNGMSYGNDSYGYSGHSVKDRMVARLEGMMDEAGSDYEKKQISDWISRIEREERSK